MQRTIFEKDHEAYRETVREFLAREIEPNYEQWEADRLIDRSAWLAAGKSGIVGLAVPEEFGGSGVTDFRFRYVVAEEIARTATTSFGSGLALQDDIAIPYIANLGTDEQKQRWLPGMAAGELIGAIAMTEPGTGSDLQGIKTTAVRDGDDWVINGQKTFITNGIHSDIVIVVARTDPNAGSKGFSLLVVERGMPGFSRGRKLHKVGLAGQDTAELVFEDVRVPAANLLGTEGRGFVHLMENLPLER
ncbi:acyl-CoA dehydrogenase family protein, partial [Rhodococcus koreensis]